MLNLLPGKKTYGLAGAFVLWAIAGAIAWWVDPASAIALEPESALRTVGEGLLAIFLRKGVKESGLI